MFGFILAFFILAPTLIFYASGYRYDLKRHKILKTGTLMLESKNLKKADLYLNNKLYEKKFEEKIFIYNLIPGEYEIKLEKENYFSWQKKVAINSGLTTFVQDIILFQNNVPLQIIDGEIIDFKLSPDGQKIIYSLIADPFLELYLYDLNTLEKKLLYRIPNNEKIYLDFAASSKKILLNVDQNYLVFDLQNFKQATEIKNILGFNPLLVKWDIQSDNLLYAYSQNSLYKVNLLSKDYQEFFKAEKQVILPNFFLEANDLFYIQAGASQNVLAKYNLNFKTTKNVLELNKSANYEFIKSSNNFIGLIDLDQQKLYLAKKTNTGQEINILTEEPIREINAKNAVWDDKESQLLIYDDFEINTYNAGGNEKTFINRYGQIIKKIAWYPDLAHLVISFDNSLQILDLSADNNARNITELVKLDNLNNFYLDYKGDSIFFAGKIGKQQGLYQLKLR
jgi:hypothetical protein